MLHPNLPRRRLYPYLLLAALLWLLCCAAAGCGGDSGLITAAPADTLTSTLPALSELTGTPAGARKHVSEATYELLNGPMVGLSAEGAVWSAGSLTLTPPTLPTVGVAWAIFKLSGFPDDGAVYPTAVTIDKDLPAPCYIAVSNYARGTWDITKVFSGSLPLSGGSGLLSPAPARSFYVAVLASEFALHATSLRVTCNADLPGGPNAALDVLSTKNAYGWPTRFGASNSDGGDGTITTVTYNFGDGSPTYATSDPLEVVEHTYMSIGAKIATVTVENDQARSDIDGAGVDVADTEKEVLVVYNYNIPESQDLAMYYSSPETGRTIDRQYILGLTLLDAGVGETIDRPTYNTAIRDAIKAWLDTNPSFKANIKYILLCKGVPHRISGADEGSIANSPPRSWASSATVDADLCLLYSDFDPRNWMWNGPNYFDWDSQGFYLQDDADFQPDTFEVCWMNPDTPSSTQTYPLNYLVGRLDAYSYTDAKAIVDRSLEADTTGTGWTVFDSTTGTYGQDSDTMVDPVWPMADDSWDSGAELLQAAGMNVLADVTPTKVYFDNPALAPDHWQNVIGYCSWGVHNGNPTTYILNDLGFNYRPGAVFMSYESFNGITFTCTNIDDPTEGHPGQGQIADFLHMGGTVAIGNAFEPFTIGVGDERWVFDRYLDHGDRWIEAAYKGLRLISWMEVVVGDPLCRVKP